jgi:hypothetical protein
MSNFINKYFNKSKAVKVFVNYPDRRMRIHYVVPKGNTVRVGKESFTINDKDFVLSKGFPTYTYVSGTPEPMNLYNQPMNKLMTSADFDVALNANVARQIFEAQGKGLSEMIPVIIGIATLAFVGFIWYTMDTQMSQMRELITQLNEQIRFLTGG